MKRTSVLVVAGLAGQRREVKESLETDHDVVEAEDGPAALRALDEVDPDVVLVELSTPATPALTLVRHIKMRARGLHLPVLGMTAEPRLRDRVIVAGADDCLGMPLDPTDLRLRIRAFARIRDQERQLRVQVEQMQRLNELKDDLVSLLVHDLRNPLSGVRAILEAMSVHGDTPYAAEIESALRGADRIQDALEDLLQVRQLEEDRLTIEREPHLVRALIDEASTSFATAAHGREVTLELHTPVAARVRVDGALVRRALENLVGNALRHAPRRTAVRVEVAQHGTEVEIQVLDRGPGIPALVRQQLFQKFGQVGSRKTTDRRGFGLGLYLVALVASAHGGRVWASERDGGGAVFHLVLPAYAPDPGPADDT